MKILQQIVTASTLVIGSSLFAQVAKPATAPATAPTAAGQAAPAAPAEFDPANAPIDEHKWANSKPWMRDFKIRIHKDFVSKE